LRIFIYPGTFDPFTNGHVDIARRAAGLCDKLIVAVLSNNNKRPVFNTAERKQMAEDALIDLPSLEVVSYDGLLVDLYRELGASAVVRGLRSESDFRFEAEIAAANKLLLPQYETFLLPCRIDLAFTSSTIVKEVASYGGDISGMVPPMVKDRIIQRLLVKKDQ
jgi:pantetheine-phosphate adenylyltransferase